MPSYLQKRRRRWYAILEIPKALRPHFGNKPRFVQSLETESRTVAERRVLQVVAGWKRGIAAARGEGEDDGDMWHQMTPSRRGRPEPPVSAKALWRALRTAETRDPWAIE